MSEAQERVSVKKETPKYTKEKIVTSKKYSSRADILNVLLEDGETYELDTVDKMIEKFMKGKVN